MCALSSGTGETEKLAQRPLLCLSVLNENGKASEDFVAATAARMLEFLCVNALAAHRNGVEVAAAAVPVKHSSTGGSSSSGRSNRKTCTQIQ